MINLIHNCSMNNVVLLLGIFIATLGLTQTSSGLTLGMSSEKILETQHLILLGTVDSVETRSGDTEYDITVLEYVKIPIGFNKVDTLHVVGCGEGQIGGCITFDEGQDVLFILDERDNMYLVSELSFVSPNPNCTMDEIFRYNDEKYDGLSLYQGSKNNRYLYTNQPIIAQYYYFNKNLEATSVDVTIRVVDDFPDILKEETIRLDLEECQPKAKAEMEFVIDSPGSFAISAKVEGNGGGEAISGVKVIDYVVPPLKQFKSGISIDEIQCREGLELIFKSSDDSPACISPETKQQLIEREWATMVNNIPLAQSADPRCMNLTTIKHNVNFDLKTPTYLPKDYVYLCGDGLEGSNEARLLFGKAYLKNSTSLIGEVNKYIDEGAVFLYSDHAPRFSEGESNSTEYILNTIREANERNPSLNLKQISINGHVGWANERCEVCGKQTANFANNTITSYSSTPSRIQFYDENDVVYFFQSNIPLDDLIKVAQSIK